MPSSEVARLARRVDHLDETVRAISDTLLDIKDTQDRHTEALGELTGALVEVRGIRGIVDGHTEALGGVQSTLGQHGELLSEILRRLDRVAS